MPNKIETLADGKMSVELETGEKFSGDAMEVTTKLAEAQVNTKRWGQGFKQELETLKATPPVTPPPVTPPPADANEAQLQSYLLTQTAKGLGYNSADEYKADLAKVKGMTEKVNNQLVATEFLSLNQDFPNTPEAVDAISKKIDEMKWNFDAQSMTAAHALLVREHQSDATKGYAALTPEQVNSQWADNMQRSSRTPPPMLRGNAPDNQPTFDPYAGKIEDLRALAIRQQLEGK